MFELDEVAREVKRLSDEVLLLTSLVRELQILVEREIGIVRKISQDIIWQRGKRYDDTV